MLHVAIVECPKGTLFKYEIEGSKLILDRPIKVKFPFNYGFIKNTIAEDGDPVDVFLVTDKRIIPGAHVKVSIMGGFHCLDNGVKDDKLVGLVYKDEHHYLDEEAKMKIRKFLSTYKRNFQVGEWFNFAVAERIIEEAHKPWWKVWA